MTELLTTLNKKLFYGCIGMKPLGNKIVVHLKALPINTCQIYNTIKVIRTQMTHFFRTLNPGMRSNRPSGSVCVPTVSVTRGSIFTTRLNCLNKEKQFVATDSAGNSIFYSPWL